MALFQELNDQGITIVLVTHEPTSPSTRSASSRCATAASCATSRSQTGTTPPSISPATRRHAERGGSSMTSQTVWSAWRRSSIRKNKMRDRAHDARHHHRRRRGHRDGRGRQRRAGADQEPDQRPRHEHASSITRRRRNTGRREPGRAGVQPPHASTTSTRSSARRRCSSGVSPVIVTRTQVDRRARQLAHDDQRRVTDFQRSATGRRSRATFFTDEDVRSDAQGRGARQRPSPTNLFPGTAIRSAADPDPQRAVRPSSACSRRRVRPRAAATRTTS